jgi:hypothetical protein
MTDVLPLEMLLAEVDSVVADLDAAIPRLTLTASYGERTSSGSKTAPAPVNIDAVSAKHALHTWLMGASLRIDQPITRRLPLRPLSPQALSSHLLMHMPLIVANGWVDTFHTQLQPLMRDCNHAANTTADRNGNKPVFAGTCAECNTELYATRGQPEARCKGCGATYEVLKWQAHAATAKNYYIGTATDLSRKLSAPQYGYQITPDQIRKWATKRGESPAKIVRANPETDETGKPIPPAYRLGDLLDLMDAKLRKRPLNGAA